MGFFDSFSDILSAAAPWSSAEAEGRGAVRGGVSEETTPAQKDDGGEGEVKDESGPKPGDSDDGEEQKQVGGKAAGGSNEGGEKYGPAGDKDDAKGLAGAAAGEDDEEEEEEDEDEPVDQKDQFEAGELSHRSIVGPGVGCTACTGCTNWRSRQP